MSTRFMVEKEGFANTFGYCLSLPTTMRDESSGQMLMRMPDAVGASRWLPGDSSCLQALSEPPTRHALPILSLYPGSHNKLDTETESKTWVQHPSYAIAHLTKKCRGCPRSPALRRLMITKDW